MKRLSLVIAVLTMLGIGSSSAQALKISIGIRETGGSGPAFANGGATGGIEWVNLDGQTLTANGTWQLFTFVPSAATLTAFAGATANGVLDTDWATLEHVRILNSDGLTAPIRMWIDDVANTDSGGTTTEGFESFSLNSEVIFQEPSFSGSTSGNILAGSSSLVSSSDAVSGSQSDEIGFQFIDNSPTRWVRLTTFGTPNLPNPAMHVRESAVVGSPSISFYAKAIIVPEPASLTLGLVGLGLCAWFRRPKA
jgi:hypothetical protein